MLSPISLEFFKKENYFLQRIINKIKIKIYVTKIISAPLFHITFLNFIITIILNFNNYLFI